MRHRLALSAVLTSLMALSAFAQTPEPPEQIAAQEWDNIYADYGPRIAAEGKAVLTRTLMNDRKFYARH